MARERLGIMSRRSGKIKNRKWKMNGRGGGSDQGVEVGGVGVSRGGDEREREVQERLWELSSCSPGGV